MLQIIGALIGGLSTGLSMMGQYQAAKDAKKLAAYRMAAADAEARNIELQSHENVRRGRIDMRSYLADVETAISVSGMVNTGSMAQAQADAAGNLELQIQDAARAEKMQADNVRRAGAMGAWEAGQQSKALLLSALSTGMRGFGRVAASFDWKPGAKSSTPSVAKPLSNYGVVYEGKN